MRAFQHLTVPRAPAEARPLRQFGVGRACLVCGANLSRYNSSRFCFIHQPKSFRMPDLR